MSVSLAPTVTAAYRVRDSPAVMINPTVASALENCSLKDALHAHDPSQVLEVLASFRSRTTTGTTIASFVPCVTSHWQAKASLRITTISSVPIAPKNALCKNYLAKQS